MSELVQNNVRLKGQKKLRFIDLFAGIGGIRLGFENAFKENSETVFVSEWDSYAQKTYLANFPEPKTIAGDITKIDEKEIPPFDICLAGFPCQAFSMAGQRKGFDDNAVDDAEMQPGQGEDVRGTAISEGIGCLR